MAQTINVNTTPGQFMPTLYYSQGDIGREFEIVLASSDGWSIPAGSTVEMVATKPSGLGFTVSGTLSGNVASFVTTETMTNEWGRYPAEIRIKSGTDVIGTANFYLNGERNPHPDGTTDGDAESLIPELTVLVERVEAAAASVLDMTVVAETLPAGSDATYSYDEETNTATFGIPRGRDGIDGEVTFEALNGATAVQSVSDNTPYLFRQTNEGNAGHNEYDEVIGGTVAWNQLQSNTFASTAGITVNSATISTANNVCSMTATAQNGRIGLSTATVNNHIYLAMATIKTSSTAVCIQFWTSERYVSTTGSFTTIGAISKVVYEGSRVGYPRIIDGRASGWDEVQIKNVMTFDLTQMFGSTIADYIYSLEQATAGAGVAWFKKLFNKPYYVYNAGELKSVSGLVSHDMTGFNQWNEEWESGNLNGDTGAEQPVDVWSRSKFIPVIGGTTYYLNVEGINSTNYAYVFKYDSDKNYLGFTSQILTSSTFTLPSNCSYIRIEYKRSFATVANYKVCINLSWDGSRNGEYEPYELHSYPLDSDLTLRGIPKLDANNNLYYDGDVYEADGTVTRKYGIVDLGTLTWTAKTDSVGQYFQSSQINGKKTAPSSLYDNMICPKYTTTGSTNVQDKQIASSVSSPILYVRDTSFSSASDFKTAMSGVYLVYELATPTTETAEPYQHAQVCDPYGTEEYVTTSIVPVGHNTEYPKTLSDIKPTANGNYVLKCTVTNGVATYEWVSA